MSKKGEDLIQYLLRRMRMIQAAMMTSCVGLPMVTMINPKRSAIGSGSKENKEDKEEGTTKGATPKKSAEKGGVTPK